MLVRSTRKRNDAFLIAFNTLILSKVKDIFCFNLINSTYFLRLNQTMNHTWIDPNIINDNNKKSDKSPVPSAMWDQRIYLSFPGRRGIKLMIKNCRAMLLRSYRRRLML